MVSSSSPAGGAAARTQCSTPAERLGEAPDGGDRGAMKLPSTDCNLVSLCDHIQMEGFNSGAFSDVVVQAMGTTYRLHRLILSRSSYFRNMLHGPWKEAGAPTLDLHIDDANINSEAITMSLAYMYGHHPDLNDNNAFRVLAGASFLDLQDLCAISTDFIISSLQTSNFLSYQVFAECQDYGVHGERVSNACWGYLCQSASVELREVLPKLSSQTLHALLTSDELWVLDEEKRFELALYCLLAKVAMNEAAQQESLSSDMEFVADSSVTTGKCSTEGTCRTPVLETELKCLSIQEKLEEGAVGDNILVELTDCVAGFHGDVSTSEPKQMQQKSHPRQHMIDPRYSLKMEEPASEISPFGSNTAGVSSFMDLQNNIEARKMETNDAAAEGPSGESTCYQLNNGDWISKDQCYSTSRIASNEWGRCNVPSMWGGRIVGRRHARGAKVNWGVGDEDYDTFANIFEGGSILYCNMSFEMLLNVRRQLEELGFPCKALNDHLWLQMLLSHRIQAIGADTCKNCCLTSEVCACRQSFGYPPGGTSAGYYRRQQDQNFHPGNNGDVFPGNNGDVYVANAQGEGGLFGTARVPVRGAIDGLAGIGRQTTFVSGAVWPPTRYVFSRVPFGLGNRNGQQSLGNGESDARAEYNGEIAGDGLTAVVGLSQGNNVAYLQSEQMPRAYEPEHRNIYTGPSLHRATELPLQILESQEGAVGLDWESSDDPSISLDMNTPLRHFPPFRFGVEFEDVHRLVGGQVHSPEVYYAGSLWKISVQSFGDEDPQGRRTLGLFLHRRKAEAADPLRKDQMHATCMVDSREKVTARYQLMCPSKREVMVFGSFKGTLLPKAPKGWGWRTALLFDELGDLLQGRVLRVGAVVQLV